MYSVIWKINEINMNYLVFKAFMSKGDKNASSLKPSKHYL